MKTTILLCTIFVAALLATSYSHAQTSQRPGWNTYNGTIPQRAVFVTEVPGGPARYVCQGMYNGANHKGTGLCLSQPRRPLYAHQYRYRLLR
ncbi:MULTISPECIES: hypothetical protein [unclassified Spirosoma]|uniref:hypothetical protein n=1 Tax=unclassified Spirosoma TaxID=2621999 RepID=UPI001AC9C793|nr:MULTISPECIES: hypothetical protein [unclassified Spirosoma]MBN8826960.1 hypothetical protein [Spirosoma sp.]